MQYCLTKDGRRVPRHAIQSQAANRTKEDILKDLEKAQKQVKRFENELKAKEKQPKEPIKEPEAPSEKPLGKYKKDELIEFLQENEIEFDAKLNRNELLDLAMKVESGDESDSL